jgi:hypothetical protein
MPAQDIATIDAIAKWHPHMGKIWTHGMLLEWIIDTVCTERKGWSKGLHLKYRGPTFLLFISIKIFFGRVLSSRNKRTHVVHYWHAGSHLFINCANYSPALEDIFFEALRLISLHITLHLSRYRVVAGHRGPFVEASIVRLWLNCALLLIL